MLLSTGLMLQHVGRDDLATRLTSAIDRMLAAGLRTRDLRGSAGTSDVTEALVQQLH